MSESFSSAVLLGARSFVLSVAGLLVISGQPSTAVAGQAPEKLVVAIHYVVPDFVGGAKVRTPDAIDDALVLALADNTGIATETGLIGQQAGAEPLNQHAMVVLSAVDPSQQPEEGRVSIPVGYPVKARAIMRTDTDIKRWEHLAGRTVCLSEGGLYVGEMARRYGAIEQVYPAPADSLLALRIGDCDVAVHDDVLLAELIKLPEWKKFSASLTTTHSRGLHFSVAANQPELTATLKRVVAQWNKQGVVRELNRERVRDIAFEVYLDQEVTDCH